MRCRVKDIKFSCDGSLLAALLHKTPRADGLEGYLTVWDTASARVILSQDTGNHTKIAWAPRRQQFLLCGASSVEFVFPTSNWTRSWPLSLEHPEVVWSPNSSWWAAVQPDALLPDRRRKEVWYPAWSQSRASESAVESRS